MFIDNKILLALMNTIILVTTSNVLSLYKSTLFSLDKVFSFFLGNYIFYFFSFSIISFFQGKCKALLITMLFFIICFANFFGFISISYFGEYVNFYYLDSFFEIKYLSAALSAFDYKSFFLYLLYFITVFLLLISHDYNKLKKTACLVISSMLYIISFFHIDNLSFESRFVQDYLYASNVKKSFKNNNILRNKYKQKLNVQGRSFQQKQYMKASNENYNIIIIRLEEVGTNKMQLYGHHKKTTPFLNSLLENKKNIVFFKKHYTNSGATDVSTPSLLVGAKPSDKLEKQNQYPRIFELSKNKNYINIWMSPYNVNWANIFERVTLENKIDYKDHVSHGFEFDFCRNEKEMFPKIDIIMQKMNEKNRSFVSIFESCSSHGRGRGVPFYSFAREEQAYFLENNIDSNYEKSIFINDLLIKKIFSSLEENGLLNKTFIFIVSDHGTDLSNRKQRLVNYYQEVLRTPFVVVIPDSFRKKSEKKYNTLSNNKSKNTSNIDLVPTIFDIMYNTNSLKTQVFLEQFPGKSLFRTIDYDRVIEVVNTNPEVRRWYQDGFSLIIDKYKFIVEGKNHSLFNLIEDPMEQNNIIDKMPQNINQKIQRYIKEHHYLPQIFKLGHL